MKIIFILILLLYSTITFAKQPSLYGNVFSVSSIDSPYTPTSSKNHNYRYRAVFSQDYHNEFFGRLYIEKVQRPDAMGSSFTEKWKRQIKLKDIKEINSKIKKLSFESRLGCCDFLDLEWNKKYQLTFTTFISTNKYHCITGDVRKGKNFTITCKRKK